MNVSADQIEKLMAERRAAERAEVEKNEPSEPEQPPQPRDAARAEKEEISCFLLFASLPYMSIRAGVVVAVALQEIDDAPHAQASAQGHNEGLQVCPPLQAGFLRKHRLKQEKAR